MLFLLIGMLKPDVNEIPPEVEGLASGFIGQPLIHIRTAGPLRDTAGKKIGMMMLVDLEDHETAEKFMSESPLLRAGLFQEVRALHYTPVLEE